jgi:hypothetical protein
MVGGLLSGVDEPVEQVSPMCVLGLLDAEPESEAFEKL